MWKFSVLTTMRALAVQSTINKEWKYRYISHQLNNRTKLTVHLHACSIEKLIKKCHAKNRVLRFTLRSFLRLHVEREFISLGKSCELSNSRCCYWCVVAWKIVNWMSPAAAVRVASPSCTYICRLLYKFYYRVFQFIEQLPSETEDIIIFRSLFSFTSSPHTPWAMWYILGKFPWNSEKKVNVENMNIFIL